MLVLSTVFVRVAKLPLPGYGCCVGTNYTSAAVTPFKQSCPSEKGNSRELMGRGKYPV